MDGYQFEGSNSRYLTGVQLTCNRFYTRTATTGTEVQCLSLEKHVRRVTWIVIACMTNLTIATQSNPVVRIRSTRPDPRQVVECFIEPDGQRFFSDVGLAGRPYDPPISTCSRRYRCLPV